MSAIVETGWNLSVDGAGFLVPKPDAGGYHTAFSWEEGHVRHPQHDQEMMRFFKSLIEREDFKPVIDRQYELNQIVEAYKYVETGRKIGNVVISVE